MAHYIDKSALAAEIKRLEKINQEYKKTWKWKFKWFYRTIIGRLEVLEGLKNFLDTLEVKEVQEEPVSEELENAAFDYAESCKYEGGDKLLCVEHFKADAKWKAEQFEKERLKQCDTLTKEQAQIESDFVVNFIKKNNRIPTFIDAIEYGMKLKLKEENKL